MRFSGISVIDKNTSKIHVIVEKNPSQFTVFPFLQMHEDEMYKWLEKTKIISWMNKKVSLWVDYLFYFKCNWVKQQMWNFKSHPSKGNVYFTCSMIISII